MLLTKFVNKFNVTEDEPELRVMIAKEIDDLLGRGAATEVALNKTDRKLETSIRIARVKKNEPAPSEKPATPAAAPSDALSVMSHKSVLSKSICPPSGRSFMDAARPSREVYFCDRAATMIPTDDQWKEIVENGIKEHQQKEAAKLKMRLDQRKAVQAEQLAQMKLKNEKAKKEKDEFREFFLKNGTKAYDAYYAF